MRPNVSRCDQPLTAPLPVSEDALDILSGPSAHVHLAVRYGWSIPGGMDIHVVGARQRVHRKRIAGGHRAAFVRVPSGTHRAVFGIPANALVGHTLPIDDVWNRSDAQVLLEKLADQRDAGAAASVLEQAIAERVAAAPVGIRQGLVHHAADLLERATVGDVSTQLGVSERHLRRVFQDSIGVNPKAYARLKRFDRAVFCALEDLGASWSGVAVEAGYYDQAHLIAEFHSIAGTTPQKFMSEIRDQRRLITFRG